jgi:hypothetical protein
MHDFECVLSLARAYAPCEEAVHLRAREEPAVLPAAPRPEPSRAEPIPLRVAGSRR